MSYTLPLGAPMRRALSLSLSLLLLAGCSARDNGLPLPKPQPKEGSSTLHLSVRAPRSVALRGLDEEDPMLQISTLHFAFYSEATQLSTQLREVKVTSVDQLKDINLSLPEGAYKLVVVANATRPLLEQIAIGRPLSAVSGYMTLFVDGSLLLRALSSPSPSSMSRGRSRCLPPPSELRPLSCR